MGRRRQFLSPGHIRLHLRLAHRAACWATDLRSLHLPCSQIKSACPLLNLALLPWSPSQEAGVTTYTPALSRQNRASWLTDSPSSSHFHRSTLTPFLMFFKTSFFSTTCSYFPVGAVIISHHHGYYESLSWGLCFQPCPRASSTLLCSREMQLIISFSLNPFFLPSDFRKSPNLLTWLI